VLSILSHAYISAARLVCAPVLMSPSDRAVATCLTLHAGLPVELNRPPGQEAPGLGAENVFDFSSPAPTPSPEPGPLAATTGDLGALKQLLALNGMELFDPAPVGGGMCMAQAAAISNAGDRRTEVTLDMVTQLTTAALDAIEAHYNVDEEFSTWVNHFLEAQGMGSLQVYAQRMQEVQVRK
jgi:hypothetical protein